MTITKAAAETNRMSFLMAHLPWLKAGHHEAEHTGVWLANSARKIGNEYAVD
jgi:hypothetical protein